MTAATTKAILRRCDSVSDTLKSLSHPVRLKILCQLIQGEKSVNELVEFCGISQSAMSQFLKRMKEEGILSSRRDWNRVYYSVADRRLLKLLEAIKRIYT